MRTFILFSSILAGALTLLTSRAMAQETETELVKLRPDIPGDFFSPARGAGRTLLRLQDDFDIYSWETFLALNWPVKPGQKPDPSLVIGSEQAGKHPTKNGDAPSAWEDWRIVQELFLSDRRPPAAWPEDYAEDQSPQNRRSELRLADLFPGMTDAEADKLKVQLVDGTMVPLKEVLARPEVRVINKIGKMHTWFATEQSLDSGPLIDRNGRYVRYEILLNREAYEFVRTHELYTGAGQRAYVEKNERIVFPAGRFELLDKNDPGKGPKPDPDVDGKRMKTEQIGAILLKAAWKELSAEEDASGRFHTRLTLVYTPHDPKNNPTDDSPFAKLVPLGLVGLHIVHKSEDVAQWNWSTFEHVDNCPQYGQHEFVGDPKAAPRYSFFDPILFGTQDRIDADRSLNLPPPRPWHPADVEPVSRRTQVVRMIPLTPEVRKLNAKFHAKLKAVNPKSVWQHYQLISTQWPTRPAGLLKSHEERIKADVLKSSSADLLGGPAPSFLASSVMETYIQGRTPNSSSSCMECHANAVSRSGHFSDFTFILERAKD
jgi:hypothetical protein